MEIGDTGKEPVIGEGGDGLGGEFDETGGVGRTVVAFLEIVAVGFGEVGVLDFLELVA